MAPSKTATVAGGCFWCIEAAFEELAAVERVVSGYAGGHIEDPTYEAVCTGETGHAEAVRVTYDSDELSYEDLLAVFFAVHDPTTVDRQGPDVGSQYRSAIFYRDEAQRDAAEAVIERLAPTYDDDIVTEVEPLETFYEAEAYHQNYFEKNSAADGSTNDAYCQFHVVPKIEKVREEFADEVGSPTSD